MNQRCGHAVCGMCRPGQIAAGDPNCALCRSAWIDAFDVVRIPQDEDQYSIVESQPTSTESDELMGAEEEEVKLPPAVARDYEGLSRAQLMERLHHQ